jgi:hypothetical protein
MVAEDIRMMEALDCLTELQREVVLGTMMILCTAAVVGAGWGIVRLLSMAITALDNNVAWRVDRAVAWVMDVGLPWIFGITVAGIVLYIVWSVWLFAYYWVTGCA